MSKFGPLFRGEGVAANIAKPFATFIVSEEGESGSGSESEGGA